MKRDGFVFYRSFAEAIEKLDETVYKEIVEALIHYSLDGEVKELSPVAHSLFVLMKPQIDANNKRYENGCKGGRKTKAEPNDNQTETKTEPKEKDKEKEKDKDIYIRKKNLAGKFGDYKQTEIDFDEMKKNLYVN